MNRLDIPSSPERAEDAPTPHLRRSDDTGLTLIELLVAMVVASFIAVLTTTLVIGIQNSNQQNVNRDEQIDDARSAVERISTVLRGAVRHQVHADQCSEKNMWGDSGTHCDDPAVLYAGDHKLGLYTAYVYESHKVGAFRAAYVMDMKEPGKGNFVQTLQQPSSSKSNGYSYYTPLFVAYPKDDDSTVARNVLVDEPVFIYYGPNNELLTPEPNASLSLEERSRIVAIEIRLTVQSAGPHQAPPTTYVQRVALTNAQNTLRLEG